MLSLPNGWTARSWSALRLFFGSYLALHFLQLLPWAAEVFSDAGMATAAVSPLFGWVPSPLWISSGPLMVSALVVSGAVLAGCLALGVWDRIAAGGLLWVLVCLFAANPLISNPALPHLGWMLLAHVCIPAAPSLRAVWRGEGQDWRLPPEIFAAGWLVMCVAYGYSGMTKLAAASWVDGSALSWVLQNPLARPTALRSLLLDQPELLRIATWGALGLELAAPLLMLTRKTRAPLWGLLLFLQIGLLLTVDFADLTWGMLVLQAWTFNPDWLRSRP